MFFDDSLAIAFQRGTGVSRSYVSRDPRLKNLQGREAIGMEFTILGERLADRAFKNLPAHIRRTALAWPNMDIDARENVLKGLFIQLQGYEWGYRRRPTGNGESEITGVLPAECGSWTRGPYMPNCLGLTQHLIGFARAAGARHLMVNTLVREDEAEWIRYLRSLLRMEAAVAHPVGRISRRVTAEIRKEIRRKAEGVLTNTANKQAHHCIAIQYGPEDWCLLDPYLMTFRLWSSDLDGHLGEVHDEITREPSMISLKGDYLHTPDSSGMIQRFVDRMRELYELRSRLSDISRADIPTLEGLVPIKDSAQFPTFNADEHELWEGVYEEDRVLIETLITAHKTRLKVGSVLRRQVRTVDSPVVSLKKRRELLDDSILTLLIIFLKILDNTQRPIGHPVMEFVHPSYHLGIATAHHIHIAQTKAAEPKVLQYAPSQFLLLDCLTHAKENPFDNKTVRFTVRWLQSKLQPYMFMPELQLQIPTDWKHHAIHE